VANLEEPSVEWRKSTASNTGNCVEVTAAGGSVLIRDSARPDGVVLRLPLAAWSAFTARTRGKGFRRA